MSSSSLIWVAFLALTSFVFSTNGQYYGSQAPPAPRQTNYNYQQQQPAQQQQQQSNAAAWRQYYQQQQKYKEQQQRYAAAQAAYQKRLAAYNAQQTALKALAARSGQLTAGTASSAAVSPSAATYSAASQYNRHQNTNSRQQLPATNAANSNYANRNYANTNTLANYRPGTASTGTAATNAYSRTGYPSTNNIAGTSGNSLLSMNTSPQQRTPQQQQQQQQQQQYNRYYQSQSGPNPGYRTPTSSSSSAAAAASPSTQVSLANKYYQHQNQRQQNYNRPSSYGTGNSAAGSHNYYGRNNAQTGYQGNQYNNNNYGRPLGPMPGPPTTTAPPGEVEFEYEVPTTTTTASPMAMGQWGYYKPVVKSTSHPAPQAAQTFNKQQQQIALLQQQQRLNAARSAQQPKMSSSALSAFTHSSNSVAGRGTSLTGQPQATNVPTSSGSSPLASFTSSKNPVLSPASSIQQSNSQKPSSNSLLSSTLQNRLKSLATAIQKRPTTGTKTSTVQAPSPSNAPRTSTSRAASTLLSKLKNLSSRVGSSMGSGFLGSPKGSEYLSSFMGGTGSTSQSKTQSNPLTSFTAGGTVQGPSGQVGSYGTTSTGGYGTTSTGGNQYAQPSGYSGYDGLLATPTNGDSRAQLMATITGLIGDINNLGSVRGGVATSPNSIDPNQGILSMSRDIFASVPPTMSSSISAASSSSLASSSYSPSTSSSSASAGSSPQNEATIAVINALVDAIKAERTPAQQANIKKDAEYYRKQRPYNGPYHITYALPQVTAAPKAKAPPTTTTPRPNVFLEKYGQKHLAQTSSFTVPDYAPGQPKQTILDTPNTGTNTNAKNIPPLILHLSKTPLTDSLFNIGNLNQQNQWTTGTQQQQQQQQQPLQPTGANQWGGDQVNLDMPSNWQSTQGMQAPQGPALDLSYNFNTQPALGQTYHTPQQQNTFTDYYSTQTQTQPTLSLQQSYQQEQQPSSWGSSAYQTTPPSFVDLSLDGQQHSNYNHNQNPHHSSSGYGYNNNHNNQNSHHQPQHGGPQGANPHNNNNNNHNNQNSHHQPQNGGHHGTNLHNNNNNNNPHNNHYSNPNYPNPNTHTHPQQQPQPHQHEYGPSNWVGNTGGQQVGAGYDPNDPFSSKFDVNGLKPTIFNPQYKPKVTAPPQPGGGDYSNIFGGQIPMGGAGNQVAPQGKYSFASKGPNPIQLNQYLAQPTAPKSSNSISSLNAILGTLLGGALAQSSPKTTTPKPLPVGGLLSNRLNDFVLGPSNEHKTNTFSQIPTSSNTQYYDSVNPLAMFMGETPAPPTSTTPTPPGYDGNLFGGFVGKHVPANTSGGKSATKQPNIYFYNYQADSNQGSGTSSGTSSSTGTSTSSNGNVQTALNTLGTQELSVLVQKLLGVLAAKQAANTQG